MDAVNEMQRPRWRSNRVFNRIGGALCAMFGIATVIQIIVTLILQLSAPNLIQNKTIVLLIASLSQYIIAFPVFILLIYKVPVAKKRQVKKLSLGNFLVFLIIGFAWMHSVNFIEVGFRWLFEKLFHLKQVDFLSSAIGDVNNISFILLVILAPIVEEIIFRKLILERFRVYGDKVAIILTAVLFGLYHMNFEQFVYTVALGLVLAYVACYTNRLRYCIFIHMVVNFFGGVLSLYLEKLQNDQIEILYVIGIGMAVSAGLVLSVLNRKKIQLEEPEIELATPYAKCFSAPLMMLFLIIALMFIIVLKVGPIILQIKELI